MLNHLTSVALLLAVGTSASSASSDLQKRDNCVACVPPGWKTTTTPAIGPDMAPMFVALVDSVKTIRWTAPQPKARSLADNSKRAFIPICCADYTQCVLMSNLLLPFCYDKFTTNYFLPDGTLGNIASGLYNTSTPGKQVNLITGDVLGTGASGNIYANDMAAKPNISTLAIPPVYTAAGDGGAQLTLGIAGPTTISALTVGATTVPAFTGSDGVVVPARTVGGYTRSAITIRASAGASASASARANAAGAGVAEEARLGVAAVMGIAGGLAFVL